MTVEPICIGSDDEVKVASFSVIFFGKLGQAKADTEFKMKARTPIAWKYDFICTNTPAAESHKSLKK